LVVAPGVSRSGSRYHRPFHVHPRTISLVEKLRSVSRAVVLSPTSERGEDRIIQRTIHIVIIRLAAFANAYQRPLSTAVGKLLRVRETHLTPFSDRKHEQSRPDPYVIRIKVQIRVEPDSSTQFASLVCQSSSSNLDSIAVRQPLHATIIERRQHHARSTHSRCTLFPDLPSLSLIV